jgi:hypothetical protein
VIYEARGGRKKKTRKRRTSAPARKKKYARTSFFFFFFLVRFLAFLGKGSSKTREQKLSTFQNKSPGKYFFGGGFFCWGKNFNFFSIFFVALVSASR